MDYKKLLLSPFFQRQCISPAKQAGLLYQKEKVATHHLLLYGLEAQPQVLAVRPNFATDQRLSGEALTYKHRGLPRRKKALFLWETSQCQADAPKANGSL